MLAPERFPDLAKLWRAKRLYSLAEALTVLSITSPAGLDICVWRAALSLSAVERVRLYRFIGDYLAPPSHPSLWGWPVHANSAGLSWLASSAVLDQVATTVGWRPADLVCLGCRSLELPLPCSDLWKQPGVLNVEEVSEKPAIWLLLLQGPTGASLGSPRFNFLRNLRSWLHENGLDVDLFNWLPAADCYGGAAVQGS